MKTINFLTEFPDITNQEVIVTEIMDKIEGGKCTGVCAQGCLKKNIKNNNTDNSEKKDQNQNLI